MSIFIVRHLFFRDMSKLQSVVDFDYDFSLVTNAADVHYNFKSKKRDFELSISCHFYW